MKNPRKSPETQRSLFGEILDWMLAPLLFAWPISIAITHYFATSVANYPFDQNLREKVRAIARHVQFVEGRPQVVLTGAARSLLRSDEVDNVYFRIIDQRGSLIAGDAELPVRNKASPGEPQATGEVHFRDDEYTGNNLRVAFMVLRAPDAPREHWVVVEVGETLEKRSQLSAKIIASVILPQFLIIPLAVILVWLGLSQGLRPLTRLRERIEMRDEADPSPIAADRVPEELQPLTDAFNSMLLRMQRNMSVQHRFISDAAHQLRTPLTGLKVLAQQAERENDPEQLRYALQNISGSVDRASHLVNQMLALARAEASKQSDPAFVPVDLDRLLHEIVEQWFVRALDRRIDLGYEASGRAWINGNVFLLRELINNLLDNAVRYTPDEGRITARVVEQDDVVRLEIEDSGIGISEDDARRVFDRFFRVEGTGVEGSGLGLAIVREIAELHLATASLHPRPADAHGVRAAGAIARVVFPAQRAPVAIPRAAEAPAQAAYREGQVSA